MKWCLWIFGIFGIFVTLPPSGHQHRSDSVRIKFQGERRIQLEPETPERFRLESRRTLGEHFSTLSASFGAVAGSAVAFGLTQHGILSDDPRPPSGYLQLDVMSFVRIIVNQALSRLKTRVTILSEAMWDVSKSVAFNICRKLICNRATHTQRLLFSQLLAVALKTAGLLEHFPQLREEYIEISVFSDDCERVYYYHKEVPQEVAIKVHLQHHINKILSGDMLYATILDLYQQIIPDLKDVNALKDHRGNESVFQSIGNLEESSRGNRNEYFVAAVFGAAIASHMSSAVSAYSTVSRTQVETDSHTSHNIVHVLSLLSQRIINDLARMLMISSDVLIYIKNISLKIALYLLINNNQLARTMTRDELTAASLGIIGLQSHFPKASSSFPAENTENRPIDLQSPIWLVFKDPDKNTEELVRKLDAVVSTPVVAENVKFLFRQMYPEFKLADVPDLTKKLSVTDVPDELVAFSIRPVVSSSTNHSSRNEPSVPVLDFWGNHVPLVMLSRNETKKPEATDKPELPETPLATSKKLKAVREEQEKPAPEGEGTLPNPSEWFARDEIPGVRQDEENLVMLATLGTIVGAHSATLIPRLGEVTKDYEDQYSNMISIDIYPVIKVINEKYVLKLLSILPMSLKNAFYVVNSSFKTVKMLLNLNWLESTKTITQLQKFYVSVSFKYYSLLEFYPEISHTNLELTPLSQLCPLRLWVKPGHNVNVQVKIQERIDKFVKTDFPNLVNDMIELLKPKIPNLSIYTLRKMQDYFDKNSLIISPEVMKYIYDPPTNDYSAQVLTSKVQKLTPPLRCPGHFLCLDHECYLNNCPRYACPTNESWCYLGDGFQCPGNINCPVLYHTGGKTLVCPYDDNCPVTAIRCPGAAECPDDVTECPGNPTCPLVIKCPGPVCPNKFLKDNQIIVQCPFHPFCNRPLPPNTMSCTSEWTCRVTTYRTRFAPNDDIVSAIQAAGDRIATTMEKKQTVINIENKAVATATRSDATVSSNLSMSGDGKRTASAAAAAAASPEKSKRVP